MQFLVPFSYSVKEVFIIITIKSNKIDVPLKDFYIGCAGDNLSSTRQFVLENIVHPNCTHRLYLTFDDGTANYFVLDSEVVNGSTILKWAISEEHIFKSGLITVQIKTFCEDESVIHTPHFYLYASESSEYSEGFVKDNSEFLEYENKLNELIEQLNSTDMNSFVKNSRTIAGLSLSQDISADELTNSLKTYPIKLFSSVPTSQTEGEIKQLGAYVKYLPESNNYSVELYLCHSISNGFYGWLRINNNSLTDEQISEVLSEYLKEHPVEGGTVGKDGVGIEKSAINSNGELVLTYTDGREVNVGKVVGEDGEKGDKGDNGATPTITTSDIDGGTEVRVVYPNGGGAQQFTIMDGITPVKGVDYYTLEDKAEFKDFIDEKLAEKDQQQEIFTDVLAEVGYTDNKRVNSSGNIVDWTGTDVTGYIPVKAGDVLRLKNMYIPDTYNETGNTYGQKAYAYKSDKTYLKSTFLCTVADGSNKALDRVVENGSVVQFTVAPEIFGEDVAYIIIGSTDITDVSEVYVNSTFINTNDSGLPAYWLNELSSKADTITQAMETAGRNKSAFLWYTDAHWQNNSQMSPYLLEYLCKNTPMNKVNFGGDIICDPTEFTHDNISYAYEWRKLIADLPNHHSVLGNHDANHNITDVSNIAYSFLNASEESADMVVGGNFYYYIDNPYEKTRYLYLSYLTNDHAEMMAQGQFIVDAIKSAPENWHIVAIAHRWFQYTSSSNPTVGSVPAYEAEILKIFDEYNARTTHTASNYFTAQNFADGKAKVEFCIGGHIHVDYNFETEGGIPVIITTSDANQDRVPDSEVDSGTLGTITESAVYGIIADYSDSSNTKITVVGVGRGTSRVV